MWAPRSYRPDVATAPLADPDDGDDQRRVPGVADPDTPRPPRGGLATGQDVAPGRNEVVCAARVVERARGFLDGPALHEAGRIHDAVGAMAARVERPARRAGEVVTGRQHPADIGAERILGEVAPGQATELAPGAVQAEPPVDVVEDGTRRVDGAGRRQRAPEMEAHHAPHDRLNVDAAGCRAVERLRELRSVVHRPAASSADWSDLA